ncbi:pyridine nucleotide-disulfide oxidoreductase AMID-like protein [Exophiala viscosa]|uniref:pyridine nucleotide-disulfide oxidoreductase AMID-like protein n=1 Tax=Exophiala viscosa TaxID=2486360 RepID=UPI0021980092|nr:pyridine nucleotide-disulfide oxidoreductase AMID-like protein [Exophiala viscosa]
MPSNEGAPSALLTPFKVLVLGGSYGGLAGALHLLDLCKGRPSRFASEPTESSKFGSFPVDITIVDERDGYYHLIGSPLALASREFASKAWTKFSDLPALKDIRFIQGSVNTVDCKKKQAVITETPTQSLLELDYDFLVAATGLRRVWPVVPQTHTRETYLSEAGDHIEAVRRAKEGVVVIGGGAVGIEMAAELKMVLPSQKVTLIHSRDKLCSSEPLPDEFKDRCLLTLREGGVETIMGQRVTETKTSQSPDGETTWELTLADGSRIRASHVIYAISRSVPSTTYLPASALDEEGYVKVTPRLNISSDSPNSLYHFALGDMIRWSGIKRCGGAMHMGQYAAHNIHQLMLKQLHDIEPEFMELNEFPPVMGIAIGKQGVAYWKEAGTAHGVSVLETFFGNDLGNTICWNHLQLGHEVPIPKPTPAAPDAA